MLDEYKYKVYRYCDKKTIRATKNKGCEYNFVGLDVYIGWRKSTESEIY